MELQATKEEEIEVFKTGNRPPIWTNRPPIFAAV